MARMRSPRVVTALGGALTLAAAFAAAVLVQAAQAQDQVPMPRPSPTRSAPPPTVDPAANATDDALLKGANSPFAETDLSEAPASDLGIDEGGPADVDTLDDGDAAFGGDLGGDLGTDDIGAPLDLGAAASDDSDVGPPLDMRPGSFTLEARLSTDGPPLRAGVKWRIFGDVPGPDGTMPLIAEATGGVIHYGLDPGVYFVHAAYGRAGATRRVEVADRTGGEVVVLNAGGMRLLAINGEDEPLAAADVSFDIYAPDDGGSDERVLVMSNAPPGHVIGLPAGVYHVVSRYGEANAIVRADLRVDAGKLTEATMYQKAARLTLKLVEVHGGEALADTAWSVITPAGESVVESVGAFPSVVLSAGEYTAIARHNDAVYESTFKVEPGVDRDVEVLLK